MSEKATQPDYLLLIEDFLHNKLVPPRAERIISHAVIEGGLSGSHIYHIQLENDDATEPKDVALKFTLRNSNAWTAAEKEYWFYRDLAERIPIRIPHILGLYNDTEAIVILMEFFEFSINDATKTAKRTTRDYLEVARQFGLLHASFWGKEDELPWWCKPAVPNDPDTAMKNTMERARAVWRNIWATCPAVRETISEYDFKFLLTLISQSPIIKSILDTVPRTLRHGGAGMASLLRDTRTDEIVFVDWQPILGCGPQDVSFMLRQAQISGDDPPVEETLRAYHASLVDVLGEEAAMPYEELEAVAHADRLWWYLHMMPWWIRRFEGEGKKMTLIIAGLRESAENLAIEV